MTRDALIRSVGELTCDEARCALFFLAEAASADLARALEATASMSPHLVRGPVGLPCDPSPGLENARESDRLY